MPVFKILLAAIFLFSCSEKIPMVSFNVERIGEIISSGMSQELGQNINGPSLIMVPDFVENKLGKYYLYFADHKGQEIKMAFADDLAGPWTLKSGGVLSLEASTLLTKPPKKPIDYQENKTQKKGLDSGYNPPKEYEAYIPTREQTATIPHLASPEVIIDSVNQKIVMYFHGLVEYGDQRTKMAQSKDGLSFVAEEEIVGYPYFRVFEYKDSQYAFSMPGVIYKKISKKFTPVNNIFDYDVRHSGVLVQDDFLYIFYSRVGDKPESILMSYVDMTKPSVMWKASEPVMVLKPEMDWEGANLPLIQSSRDAINVPVNQVRDPAIFVEKDVIYLLYSVRGENGIAIAKLNIN